MQEAIRIAIVEDNRDLRESLQMMIEAAPGLQVHLLLQQCGGRHPQSPETRSGRGAHGHPPALPLRHRVHPRLKDLCPELRVLILTVYEDSESIFDALKAGASGYLLKRSTPNEILAAIADVAEGGAPMSSQIARQVVASFQKPTPTLEPEGEPLSERETEVLGYITKGYSGKEVADKMHVSINTVKTHLKHIYQKLHVRSRTEILLRFRASNPDA